MSGGGAAGYDAPTRPACAVASLGARAPGPCGRHSATPRPRERCARTGGGRQSSRTSPQEGGPAGGGRTLARGGASGGFPRGRASRGGWGAASLGPPLRAPREGGRAGPRGSDPSSRPSVARLDPGLLSSASPLGLGQWAWESLDSPARISDSATATLKKKKRNNAVVWSNCEQTFGVSFLER